VEVEEEIHGDEPAFREDIVAAPVEEISRCAELVGLTRCGLVSSVEHLPDSVLDWDPPYRHLSSWAWWKTVRQILAHIALCEVGYYLPCVDWRGGLDPDDLAGRPWREQLQRSREETLSFLEGLKSSADRERFVHTEANGTWSVRKVLRRLVWHERLHWKSIQRIVRDYGDS